MAMDCWNMGKSGRQLEYTQEMGEEICLKMAVNSVSIQKLCKRFPHWPCFQTIYEWRIKVPSFGEMYLRAKQNQIELLVDEILDISDDSTHDTIIKSNTKGDEYECANSEWINRSKLRVDSRKWLAAKLAPRIYGEKKESDEKDGSDFISKNRDKINNK